MILEAAAGGPGTMSMSSSDNSLLWCQPSTRGRAGPMCSRPRTWKYPLQVNVVVDGATLWGWCSFGKTVQLIHTGTLADSHRSYLGFV